MTSTRRYNRSHISRLRNNRSRAGKKSQKIQSLKKEAQAKQWDTYEDVCGRAKSDRRGNLFDIWTKTNLSYIEIFYSLCGRSDQYDIVIYTPKKWSEGLKSQRKNGLSMPKVLNTWKDLS